MRPVPPLLLASALLVWGGFTGHLPGAIAMAVVIEAARAVPWRLELERRDLYRVADLSAVIFVLAAVYLFNRHSVHGIYAILAWQPYIFFPLLCVQCFETRQYVPLSTLVLGVRRRLASDPGAERPIDLRYPYVALCLLAASTTASKGPWFFALLCLIAGWALWSSRNRRFNALIWILALSAACALGYVQQQGLRGAQRQLEGLMLSWLDRHWWRGRDPLLAHTSIGSLGRMKMSDRVRIRIHMPDGAAPPARLREASYQRFKLGTWSNGDTGFVALDPLPLTSRWPLAEQSASASMSIEFDQKDELIVLPLPAAPTLLEHPGAFEVQRDALGTVRLEARPDPQRYTVFFDRGGTVRGAPPGPADLEVPDNYRPVVRALIQELAIDGLADRQKRAAIERFFAERFYYSTVRRDRFPGRRPLIVFLEQQRAGHCEYFASATVLLLRQAGIPARYTVGYSVQEFNALQNRYLLRARHAHSWAEAFIDGAWRVVDTTPSRWLDLDARQASTLQPVYDVLSWLWFRFKQWRSGGEDDGEWPAERLLWLLPLLIGLLAYRLRRGARRKPAAAAPAAVPGQDSEFYQVLERLAALGYQPLPGETVGRFAARLGRTASSGTPVGRIADAARTHYRYRFRPGGISVTERRRLREQCVRLADELGERARRNAQ